MSSFRITPSKKGIFLNDFNHLNLELQTQISDIKQQEDSVVLDKILLAQEKSQISSNKIQGTEFFLNHTESYLKMFNTLKTILDELGGKVEQL